MKINYSLPPQSEVESPENAKFIKIVVKGNNIIIEDGDVDVLIDEIRKIEELGLEVTKVALTVKEPKDEE